ncbi:MAG: hypothetical protein H6819_03455 [Phycisphaerales bacterium]|nr:hypothetical protein [Phycisphaerales bacterium]MCB9856253.1 hypothetical protein [Phycisphaerales bacterium]MCB9863308.1 hypothetical protein [Phycisphaerales bacterium]
MTAEGHDSNASPDAAEMASVDRDSVCFCRECPAPANRAPDPFMGRHQDPNQQTLIRFAIGLLVLVLSLAIVGAFGQRFGNAVGMAIAGVILIAAIATRVYLAHRDAAMVRRLKAAGVPELPRVGSRLRCVGEFDVVFPYGPVQDVPFEPRVFRAIIKSSTSLRIGGILLSLVPVILLVSAIARRKTWMIWIFGAMCITALVRFLRPMYFRVVPGRMDVLRYSMLRRAPMQVERHDLRTAQVIVDMRSNVVYIVEGEKVGEYSIRFMPERSAFARALFQGAVSTHAAPAVSDEEL